jgi:hypothetical protein
MFPTSLPSDRSCWKYLSSSTPVDSSRPDIPEKEDCGISTEAAQSRSRLSTCSCGLLIFESLVRCNVARKDEFC